MGAFGSLVEGFRVRLENNTATSFVVRALDESNLKGRSILRSTRCFPYS